MLQDLLLLILSAVLARAVWRVVNGVMEGLSGRSQPSQDPRGNVPARGVPMVRDPVCGIYVVPDRSVAIAKGSHRVFFCSANCRDKYRARTA